MGTQSPAVAAAAATTAATTAAAAALDTLQAASPPSPFIPRRLKKHRDKAREQQAATLWLRSRKLARVSGGAWPLSLSEACESAGIESRFRQNVHNRVSSIVRSVGEDDDDLDVGIDDRKLPDASRDRNRATAAAHDLIADPGLTAAAAAARHGRNT